MWDIESCHCVGTIPPHRLANAYPTANTPDILEGTDHRARPAGVVPLPLDPLGEPLVLDHLVLGGAHPRRRRSESARAGQWNQRPRAAHVATGRVSGWLSVPGLAEYVCQVRRPEIRRC